MLSRAVPLTGAALCVLVSITIKQGAAVISLHVRVKVEPGVVYILPCVRNRTSMRSIMKFRHKLRKRPPLPLSPDTVHEFLTGSGTPQASYHVEYLETNETHRVQESATIHRHISSDSPADSDTIWIYRIASLSKPLLSYAIVKLFSDPSLLQIVKERHPGITDWSFFSLNRTVSYILHCFAEAEGSQDYTRSSSDPKVIHYLVHFNADKNTNHIWLGPDGSILASADDIVRIATYLKPTQKQNLVYSNINYIILGHLVERASKQDLASFIKKYVLDEFGMAHTFFHRPEQDNLPQNVSVALPHLITSEKEVRIAPSRETTFDSIEVATLECYSCTEDLSKFYRGLLKCVNADEGRLTYCPEYMHHMFDHEYQFTKGKMYASTPCGILLELDSRLLGSESLNRCCIPQKDLPLYQLGRTQGRDKVLAYEKSGCDTGYSCCAYLLPNPKMFVIVLTNASGPVDVSTYIAHQALQSNLCLAPQVRLVKRLATQWKICAPRLAAMERQGVGNGLPFHGLEGIEGEYHLKVGTCYVNQDGTRHSNKNDSRSIVVQPADSPVVHRLKVRRMLQREGDGKFSVKICGPLDTYKGTSWMELTRIAEKIVRICPTHVTVDQWVSWKNLELVVDVGKGTTILKLKRKNQYGTWDIYERVGEHLS
jgi:CubicO group peptidase (beta-lactamase class C family)